MAKARSGLGRGLGSLLGGGPEGGLTQDTPPTPPVPPAPVPSESESATKEDSKDASVVIEENVYTNKEDNLTIKSVVERKADPSNQERPATDSKDRRMASAVNENEVDIDLIVANPDQPRTNFKKEEK